MLADDAAQVLPFQVLDALTTRMVMAKPCGFERDPLARGFARSDLGSLAGVALTNLLMRKLVHKHGTVRLFIGTELVATVNNIEAVKREHNGGVCE